MLQLDYRSRESLYMQIKENIKKLILTGSLANDEMLPSVRTLAADLAINVNTVQRAYKELEQEGYIYSIQGKGNFVAKVNEDMAKKNREELKGKIQKLLKEAEAIGMDKEEFIKIIQGKE